MEEGALPIANWAEEDRPREKVMYQGLSSLTDAELLSILISSGAAGENALSISQKILSYAGNNLHALGRMSLVELQKFKGVGKAKAITIKSAFELGTRRNAQTAVRKERVSCSRDVYDLFRGKMSDLAVEEFWMLNLSQANRIKGMKLISRGGVTGTVADPRLIFHSALEQMACGIILIHNHPSGNLDPSEQDVELTNRLAEAGKLLQIRVMDHLIISDSGYFSFADEGLIT